MDNYKQKNSVPLTAADCFILALEKHDHHKGLSGNTCRYLLELEGELNVVDFKNKIKNNQALHYLASLSINRNRMFSLPRWESKQGNKIDVTVHEDDSFLPALLINKKIPTKNSPLFSFDIIRRPEGNTALIFSWNHLIMDSYGAVLFLKQLNESETCSGYISDDTKIKLNISTLKEAVKAMFFLAASSKKPTSGVSPEKRHPEVDQKIKVIRFTKEETIQIDLNAPKLGAKFGRSPFYIACSARAVKEILIQRKSTISNFWIPVPQNKRKKGAVGPLLGNHLSFLFYRLNSAVLESLEHAVKSINDQMVDQIRKGIPRAYDVLMYFLRRVPSSLYYHLIKGPQGAALSGFLFTIAEDHPEELLKFDGLNVLDALSFPPNIYPPGLTTAFMRFEGRLQIMVLYYKEVLSESEIVHLEKQLKFELINGKKFIE